MKCSFSGSNIAHAFSPLLSDIHLNYNQEFTTSFNNIYTDRCVKYALIKVLMHEFGHAMGLDHNRDIDSIMNIRPFENYALSKSDISKLWHIWL